MKMIPLTQGEFALVGDEDFESLSKYKWSVVKSTKRIACYARRGIRTGNKITIEYMHRAILPAPRGFVVDHIDGNGLNNQLSNLRLADRRENARNRPKQRNNLSGFKGVCRQQERNGWKAQIRANKESHYLGLFATAELAAAAYNGAAEKLHGNFAKTNAECFTNDYQARPRQIRRPRRMLLSESWNRKDRDKVLLLLAVEYCDSVTTIQ
jgi:HNH endonuclease/AP2 domain